MARRGIVSPGDDDELFEPELLREPCELRFHLLRGADERLAAHRFAAGELRVVVGIRRGLVRRNERFADADLAQDARMLAGRRLMPRLGLGVGGERPDADRRLRFRVTLARLVVAAVELERLLA